MRGELRSIKLSMPKDKATTAKQVKGDLEVREVEVDKGITIVLEAQDPHYPPRAGNQVFGSPYR